jgi:hypothetical protein
MTNPITPVTIEVDIAGDCPVQDAFAAISEYDGDLLSFIAVGPGGGNPCLTIRFPSMSLACSYLYEVGVSPEEMDMYIID